ncbi:MAG: hypothetical protein IIU14_04415 [Ruminococcus sp.]|nr:hypothetical protein [Ruminococcus sp.]
MKELYKSPVVTVEELTKTDVLCTSGGDQSGPNRSNSTLPKYSNKLWENNGFDMGRGIL